jgi:DNA-binding CsgD family transcriptional regulator
MEAVSGQHKRSNWEKRRTVEAELAGMFADNLSNRELARAVGVSEHLVRALRQEHSHECAQMVAQVEG